MVLLVPRLFVLVVGAVALLLAAPSDARAETRVVFRSTLAYADECAPNENVELRADVILTQQPNGKYTGVGDLVHVVHEPIASWGCDDLLCTLTSKSFVDGKLWVEMTLAPSCDSPTTVTELLVAPNQPGQYPQEAWSYLCMDMNGSEVIPRPQSPWWLGSWGLAHEAEQTTTSAGAPVFRIPGLARGAGNLIGARTYTSMPDATITETTSVEVHHEAPLVVEHRAQWTRYFLQGISHQNRHDADIDWKEAGGNRSVVFRVNGQQSNAPMPGAGKLTTESLSFDVGTQYGPMSNNIEVRALRDGECSAWKPLNPPPQYRTAVPEWASAAGIMAMDGVAYSGELAWPEDLTDDVAVTVPVLDGKWGLAGGQPRTELRARSTGDAQQGRVRGNARIGLGPIAVRELALSGTTTGTLTTELHLEGNVTANLGSISANRSVGVFTLVPGAAAACSVPLVAEACAAINGWAGVTAEVRGDASLEGNFADRGSRLEFTSGSARVGMGAHAFIGVALPPPIDLAGFRIGGGGSGCVTFEVAPALAYKTHGGQLDFTASAYAPGFAGNYRASFPFGSGCAAATAALIVPPDLGAAGRAAAVPEDGRPALAGHASGRMAAAWSALATSGPRPSGDIHVALYDGQTWKAPVAVTSDAQLDARPSVAFDAAGDVVVAWERHPQAVFPTTGAQVTAFATGMEVAHAALDGASGAVKSMGTLTNNARLDFGPALCATSAGVRAVWQETSGATLAGTAADPAILRTATLSATGWSAAQPIGAPLAGVFGWELACDPTAAAGALLALSLDADADLATTADRDIHVYRDSGSGFGALRRVTSDGGADHAVHAAFTPAGVPVLAWLHGDAIWGVIGEPPGTPAQWLAPDPAIGTSFALGRVGASADRITLVWPGATDLVVATAPLAGQPWSAPTSFARSPSIETHVVLARSQALMLGVVRAGVIDAQPPALEPVADFVVLPLVIADVPGDGGVADGGGGGAGDAGGDGGGNDAAVDRIDAGGAEAGADAAGVDASSVRDAVADAVSGGDAGGGSDAGRPGAGGGGCGCSTSAAPATGAPLAVVLLLAAVGRRRTRRR